MTRFLRITAWLLLIFILFVTVAPIEFRPTTGFSPNIERFAAFTVLAFVFVSAYPDRPFLVMTLIWIAAGSFEMLQFASFGRHAELHDVAYKCAGAAAGVSWAMFTKGGLDWFLARKTLRTP